MHDEALRAERKGEGGTHGKYRRSVQEERETGEHDREGEH
jgi:hypothetical protein